MKKQKSLICPKCKETSGYTIDIEEEDGPFYAKLAAATVIVIALIIAVSSLLLKAL